MMKFKLVVLVMTCGFASWALAQDEMPPPPVTTERGNVCCENAQQCGLLAEDEKIVTHFETDPLYILKETIFEAELTAFRNLIRGNWYMTLPDGTPVSGGPIESSKGKTVSKKEAGTYSFDIASMSVSNKKGGESKSIDQICIADGSVIFKLESGELKVSTTLPRGSKNSALTKNTYSIKSSVGEYAFSSAPGSTHKEEPSVDRLPASK